MNGVCSSCTKQKHELHAKKSDLLPGINLFMCNSCIESGFEPRWTIILAGRSGGFSAIKEFIVKRKYVGPKILAEEIISPG